MELSKSKVIGVEGFEELKNSGENFAIGNLSNKDRPKSIVEFFENMAGTTYRKRKYKTLSYGIIGNELFKKT